jgi:hypothetical protein
MSAEKKIAQKNLFSLLPLNNRPVDCISYKSVHNRAYISLSCIEGCLGPKEAANFIGTMC